MFDAVIEKFQFVITDIISNKKKIPTVFEK